jgi:hypothetical protein
LRKDRDELRGLLSEYTDVLENAEDAADSLEYAIENLSNHL